MSRFSVACLDMAGTTVRDDNTVMEAFAAAIASRNLPAAEFHSAMKYARDTMGQSKIEVFRHVLGGEDAAQAANVAFEKHYAGAVAEGAVAPMPGAEELFAACRAAGIKVCLSTGFAPVTRDAIVAALGWGSLVDLRLGGGSVQELAVAGDTPADVESGLRAGAGLVVGVLSGDSARADLAAVPAGTGLRPLPGTPLILDSVADLFPHLA